MQKPWRRILIWLVLTGFFYLVIRDYYFGAVLMRNPVSLASKRQLVFWSGLVLVGLVWLYSLRFFWIGRLPAARLVEGFQQARQDAPVLLRALLAAALLLFPTYLYLYSPVGLYALGYWARLGTLLIFAFLAALLFFTRRPLSEWLLAWAGMILLGGAVFTATGWLNRVTAYPFSLTWSEGNRLWDYSMLFGTNRYILDSQKQVFTFISVGRQFLWAIPFLIPSAGIVIVRLWDALLWILPGLLLGWLAVWREPAGPRSWVWKAGLGLWSFALLSQGPIYAPLLVSAILVVLAVRSRSLLLAGLLVLAGGFYAAITRYTWTYAPGLWAALLALLQIPRPGFRSGKWKQLVRPLTLGVMGYLGGQILPAFARRLTNSTTGTDVQLVINPTSNVTRQPLLWERMLPNPTYSPGILLGTLWVALPVIILLVYLVMRRYWRPNWLQSLAVLFFPSAFLAVGLIASVKIGGGSNLHNLDMFWISLVLIAAWVLKDILSRTPAVVTSNGTLLVLLSLAMIFPATYNVQYGTPLLLPSQNITQTSIDKMRELIGKYARQGEVLFIDQRQLLTFGEITGVPLIDDYEKKYMMDQAMSDNAAYFEGFHTDLMNHRFALIVTEPIQVNYVNPEDRNFAEENNAWVKWVSDPLLQYYKPLLNFDVGVQLLVPND